jgi:4'-phosphopantetheinyl transferase
VYILYATISEENQENLITYYLPKFSIDFQKKIKRYRRWQDAQLSLLGRIVLHRGIEKFNQFYEDNAIKYTRYNKPYIEGNPVKFNISHSGELVVCALNDEHEIGIDIEKLNSIRIEDFKPQMTANEWKTINSSHDKISSFYDYWTQKEAILKAYGNGLSVPLKSFEILNHSAYIKEDKFFVKEVFIHNDYKCFIASPKDLTDIPIKTAAVHPLQKF